MVWPVWCQRTPMAASASSIEELFIRDKLMLLNIHKKTDKI